MRAHSATSRRRGWPSFRRGPRRGRALASASLLLLVLSLSGVARADVEKVTIFENESVAYDTTIGEGATSADGVVRTLNGQAIERRLKLPRLPRDLADARRITAVIHIKPVLVRDGSSAKPRPADPWTRMGSLNLVAGRPRPSPGGESDNDLSEYPDDVEIELMRFITGFGGESEFRQDLTPMAPMLSGEKTLRVYVSTYANPGWTVDVRLEYDTDGVGYRRPTFARRLMNSQFVTSDAHVLSERIRIPEDVERPRIRILSTGHATDGAAGDEFLTRTHILRVDGVEVARFRPWSERGGTTRDENPTSGRVTVEGRELWSSDLDRSGWHPSRPVVPLIIPLPELTPGAHQIDIEVLDIRPPDDATGDRGYWRVSAIIIADEPWPSDATRRGE